MRLRGGREVAALLLCLAVSCGRASDTPDLVEVARSGESIKVRQEACYELGRVRRPDAVEPLIQFLDDEVLGYCAARSLGLIRDPAAVTPLIAHLRKEGRLNKDVVWALGEIGGSAAEGALEGLSEDSTLTLGDRQLAADALRQARAR